MKKQHYLAAIALLITATTSAQLPPLYAGTKSPYQPQQQQYTPAPAGYSPVFINHVGRHGARFLTKAGSDEAVLQTLQQAGNKQALTPLGKQVLAMTKRFISLQKNNYENITGLGAAEQTAIGNRLLHNYNTAFTGKGLAIVTTYKVRTQQSANAFLAAFAGYKGKQQYEIMPDTADAALRFYDLSPAYQRYKKGAALQRAVDSLYNDARTSKAAKAINKRLFKKSFTTKAIDFATGLYDIYCAQWSMTTEMQQHGYSKDSIDLSIAFTQPELQWFCFINGAEDFLQKGPGNDTLGIQVQIAAPLLAEFINSSTDVLNNNYPVDAMLRFTHAEAISPFATLLGIPQASIPSPGIYHYNKHWSADSIIPLSANIQWIFYYNGADYVVKVLLNEKEVALPLATNSYPYYKWEEVKKYYVNKLQQLQVTPGADMVGYLKKLK